MAGRNMGKGNPLYEKWKEDYDFRTVVAALGSLIVTVVFSLYNGWLGIIHASPWHGTICIYYLLLAALRATIILAERRAKPHERNGRRGSAARVAASVLLLILNISLVVPITIMVRQQKPVQMTLIPAIAMAAYTTYKITMASVQLIRSRESTDSLVRLLRTIAFIDALVSILTLQNTLVMVASKGDGMRMLPLTALSSAVILLANLYLSILSLIHAVRGSRVGGKHWGRGAE